MITLNDGRKCRIDVKNSSQLWIIFDNGSQELYNIEKRDIFDVISIILMTGTLPNF